MKNKLIKQIDNLILRELNYSKTQMLKETELPSGFKKINSTEIDTKKVDWGKTEVYYYNRHMKKNMIDKLVASRSQNVVPVGTWYKVKNYYEWIEPKDIIAIKY